MSLAYAGVMADALPIVARFPREYSHRYTIGSGKISAITLAGAADVIFCELVNRENKKRFT